MKNISRQKEPGKVVSSSRLIRSVASSTAIETGRPIAELEAQLKAGNSKFKHVTLSYSPNA